MNPADEIVAIVDEHNTVIGSAARHEMRAGKLPHRSTYILVFNSRGELFVQKRTMTKDIYPGYYDPCTGGVVLYGESYELSAIRELEEEVGIRHVPLTEHFDFYYEDDLGRVWGRVFSCVYDGDMILQVEEVESGEFLSIATILQRAQTDAYTPDGLRALHRYLDMNPQRRPSEGSR
jgi:8-oxo-dGTP pyrophosphatase MutT (NUDIX family)